MPLWNRPQGESLPKAARQGEAKPRQSIWATLKTECFGSLVPESRHQAILMIFDYIESFYNRSRLHSSLGYKSPLDFESENNYSLN